MGGTNGDVFSEIFAAIFGAIFDRLDKKNWWINWVKPILYYCSIIIPFAYLLGWQQGYFN